MTTKPKAKPAPKPISATKLANAAKSAQATTIGRKLPANRNDGDLAAMLNALMKINWLKGPEIVLQATVSAWGESDYTDAWKWAAAMTYWQDKDVSISDLTPIPDVILRADLWDDSFSSALAKADGVLPARDAVKALVDQAFDNAVAKADAATEAQSNATEIAVDAAVPAPDATEPATRAAEPEKQLDGAQIVLPGTKEPPKASLPVLEFDNAADVGECSLALTSRVSELNEESKRLKRLGGCDKEAQAIDIKARRITEALVSKIQRQTAIPFDKSESLSDTVMRNVARQVRDRVKRKIDAQKVSKKAGETDKDVAEKKAAKMNDFEAMVGAISTMVAEIVTPMLAETAQRAHDAGIRDRRQTPERLAVEAVQYVASTQQLAAS